MSIDFHRFWLIFIDYHQFLSIISIVNDNRLIMISDTFALRIKYRLLQITRDPAIFPVFSRIDSVLHRKVRLFAVYYSKRPSSTADFLSRGKMLHPSLLQKGTRGSPSQQPLLSFRGCRWLARLKDFGKTGLSPRGRMRSVFAYTRGLQNVVRIHKWFIY